MKKLEKLEINSQKIINNDELLELRGGYSGTGCCECRNVGFVAGASPSTCHDICASLGTYGLRQCII